MKTFLYVVLVLITTACANQPSAYYKQADQTSIANYKTFSIKKLDVKGLHPDSMIRVGKAVKHALEKKGLKYVSEGGELLVRYAVGVEIIKEVDVKIHPAGSSVYTNHIVEDSLYVTLVLGISDTRDPQVDPNVIWFMSGSKKVDDLSKPQEQINQKFESIFANFK